MFFFDPFSAYMAYLGLWYVAAQEFYQIGTGPEVTRDQLGRLGRR
jgi:hypothetical protein